MNKKLKKYIKRKLIVVLVCSGAIMGGLGNRCLAYDNNIYHLGKAYNRNISREDGHELLNVSEEDCTKVCNKVAYITIDDGPSKYTDKILNILDKHGAKATFFMIDSNMKKYPSQVNNIIESGNSAGFHSVSHDIHKLYKTKTSAKEEFDINRNTFYEITGEYTNIIRLPYGSKPYTPKETYDTLIESGYKMWDWNIDTQDWKVDSVQILENVETYSKNKDEIVILMHERAQSVEALESILEYLKEEGYILLAINQEQEPQNFWTDNMK